MRSTVTPYGHRLKRFNHLFLSKPDILKYLESKNQTLSFDPEVPVSRVKQVSIDLLLGRVFTTLKKPPKFIDAIHMDPSLWASQDLWETKEKGTFLLKPGKLVLAQTLERVHIPGALMGFVEGRSSYARIGISVHVTAPKIDPGFNGHITLEMVNFGKLPVRLRAEIDTPAQLLLAEITTPLEASELYGAKPEDVFQNQKTPLPKRVKS